MQELMVMGEKVEADLEPYWNVDPDTPEAAALDAPDHLAPQLQQRSGVLGRQELLEGRFTAQGRNGRQSDSTHEKGEGGRDGK